MTSRKWDRFTPRNSAPDILVPACFYKGWIFPRSHDLLGSVLGCQYVVWMECVGGEWYLQRKRDCKEWTLKGTKNNRDFTFFKGWLVVLILLFHHMMSRCTLFLWDILMHDRCPLLFPKQTLVSAFPFPTNGPFDAINSSWFALTSMVAISHKGLFNFNYNSLK